MNIDDSIYLDVDINVVDEAGRGGIVGVDSGVDDEVRSIDNKGVEL